MKYKLQANPIPMSNDHLAVINLIQNYNFSRGQLIANAKYLLLILTNLQPLMHRIKFSCLGQDLATGLNILQVLYDGVPLIIQKTTLNIENLAQNANNSYNHDKHQINVLIDKIPKLEAQYPIIADYNLNQEQITKIVQMKEQIDKNLLDLNNRISRKQLIQRFYEKVFISLQINQQKLNNFNQHSTTPYFMVMQTNSNWPQNMQNTPNDIINFNATTYYNLLQPPTKRQRTSPW